MVYEVYRQNQQEEAEREHGKNWIPDNIMLTTQEEAPIIYINSTNEKPEIYPIKLATITLNAEVPVYFNLKVIGLYLPIDDHIVGVKCEHVSQRGWLKQKARKKPKAKIKGRKDRSDFYNQCTINVKPYGDGTDELINMKMFPNGKIGFTGVKKIRDAEVALEYVLSKINDLNGLVMYSVNHIEKGNTKNFRKKIKLRKEWLEYISKHVPEHLSVDWDEFIESINTKGANPYPNGLHLSNEVSYSLTYLEMLEDHFALTTDYKLDRVSDLMDPIEMSFRDSTNNYTTEEYEILANYYSATSQIGYEDYVEFLSLDDVVPILYYCMQRDTQMDLDKLMDLLGKRFTYDELAQIKSGLITAEEDEIEHDHQRLCEVFLYVKYRVDTAPPPVVVPKKKGRKGKKETEKKLQLNLTAVEPSESEFDETSTLSDGTFDLGNLRLTQETGIVAPEDTTKSDDVRPVPLMDRYVLEFNAWSDPTGKPKSSDLMDYYSPDCINISNINTTFNTNFILCRKKLHQLLVGKYEQSDCSLEPNYGGINLKFMSVVDCEKHNDASDEGVKPGYNGCKCKSVSILIFGNITLITGGRSYRQIIDAYEFIKSVMFREFVKILKINKDVPNPLDKYPNMIASNTHKYFKKKFVLDNPKNHFLLKKLGLLNKYN
jgi:hypothetical protein